MKIAGITVRNFRNMRREVHRSLGAGMGSDVYIDKFNGHLWEQSHFGDEYGNIPENQEFIITLGPTFGDKISEKEMKIIIEHHFKMREIYGEEIPYAERWPNWTEYGY